jgi:predicted site-specific integrase-resolvase
MKLLPISEAAKRIGVHPNRLRAWEKQGLINPVRLPSGQRRFSEEKINRILGIKEKKEGTPEVAIYARVSTKKQNEAGNLKRQLERLRQYAYQLGFPVRQYTDIVSGLNQNRRGLDKLIKAAEKREIQKLIQQNCTEQEAEKE